MNQYDLTAQLAHIYRKGSFSSSNGHKPIIGITANYGEQNAGGKKSLLHGMDSLSSKNGWRKE